MNRNSDSIRDEIRRRSKIRVLFIDDNEDLCTVFRMFLERTGFLVQTFLSAAEGLAYLENYQVDAVISDYSMPEMDGISFLKHIRQKDSSLPFIILTGADSKQIAIEALNAGADFYQNKSDAMEIQVLDIGNKIRILVSKREADLAVHRKDAILEAVSYAADQFLRGNVWENETCEILRRLGEATGADLVYLCSIVKNSEELKISGSWSGVKGTVHSPPLQWPPGWFDMLSANRMIECAISDLPEEEQGMFMDKGIRSILLIPVLSNKNLSGCLIFEDLLTERRRNTIETGALRMAAEVIGSARYRKHIEEFFKYPVEEAIIGIFLICDNILQYVNERFSHIFGYQRDELLKNIQLSDLVHPDHRLVFEKKIPSIQCGDEPAQNFEFVGIRKDGSEVYLEIYLTLVSCQGNRCITGNLIDITDRKMIERALQESESRYRQLAEQVDDLIILIDNEQLVRYLNPAAEKSFSHLMLGPGTDIHALFQDEDNCHMLSLIEDARKDGVIHTGIARIRSNRDKRWYDISISPLQVQAYEISSFVLFFHDITDRIEREEEIRRRGLAQIELNMEQFQILNDEIRNPLQVIKALNTLQDGEYSARIDQQIEQIDELINKLDKAWIQSEKVHNFLIRHFRYGGYIEP